MRLYRAARAARIAAGLAIAWTIASCARSEAFVQIKGSDTMVNLGQAWAEAFMGEHPDVGLAVTGGGSGTGIAALLARTCDIAQSSRPITDEEKEAAKQAGLDVQEFTVAMDGLAVIVHPSNPVSELAIDQLSGIFSGRVASWKDLGGPEGKLLVLSRERNSGTHVYFLEHVVRRGNAKGREEFASTVLMMPSSQAIADEVAQSPLAIGYVGLGYVSEAHKVIAVTPREGEASVKPTVETVHQGAYPISRALYFYTPAEPEATVKEFIDFVLSHKGQEIALEMDFVSARATA